jgi:CDP-glucose 4,6-dehydratase
MENLVEEETSLFKNVYSGKKVFITGHTGFKGSWLAYWLRRLNADIMGYSLPPPTVPNHFELLDLDIASMVGDIRDKKTLQDSLIEYRPDIVFHLAAQAIVRQSYQEPIETFTTNCLGTVNLLEACRLAGSVKAVIVITSDKCYENKEWSWGYRENDTIGGFDPYSASKGCVELIISCWRNSFFNLLDYGRKHMTLLASTRAGNVIGGGDWAVDRIVPDLMRSATTNAATLIRNPRAIRPWQHVLESLSGYLLLGQKLLDGRKEFSGAWNFGPGSHEKIITVGQLAESFKNLWPHITFREENTDDELHETTYLRLDISKAQLELRWNPVWDLSTGISRTVNWYKSHCELGKINTSDDLQSFTIEAQTKRHEWAVE